MKILKFKYTKKLDDVSERVFVPLSAPSAMHFGIDVSHLAPNDQEKVLEELAIVINEQERIVKEKIMELDLGGRYRFFIPSRISDTDISYKGNTCPELTEEKAQNPKDS